ncbi:hypothetical protein NM208_g9225 [Fusarium decemcellulare]|uniref:Uncharacterized protein n=1 Tax=Fusarium decemcellulare TaxID=57161 RepID=A0ACC1S2D7_9HYPO|nr:hypothetical protein NM208_g9225 [Fusarium decemcellulare]
MGGHLHARSGPWIPQPDPHRPEFPYLTGLSLTIRRHIPPPPFGVGGYKKGPERQEVPGNQLYDYVQTEWCLKHPPADTPPHPDSRTQALHIIDGIACRDGRGAQIVRCHLDQDESQIYAAKIYDALYYSYRDTGYLPPEAVAEGYGVPVDVTSRADQDYSREAAAYEDIQQARVDGRFSPKYFGSWTFDMPFRDQTRPVRLILMEWIQGVSVQSLIDREPPLPIPPTRRLEILAKAMELESKLDHHSVRHRDFAPRNVLLVGSDLTTEMPQVFLIDFNRSVALKRPNCKGQHAGTVLPINPRYHYWGGCPNEFLDWVPQPHRSQPAAFQGWVRTQWEGSGEFTAPLFDDELCPWNQDVSIEIVSPLPDNGRSASPEPEYICLWHQGKTYSLHHIQFANLANKRATDESSHSTSARLPSTIQPSLVDGCQYETRITVLGDSDVSGNEPKHYIQDSTRNDVNREKPKSEKSTPECSTKVCQVGTENAAKWAAREDSSRNSPGSESSDGSRDQSGNSSEGDTEDSTESVMEVLGNQLEQVSEPEEGPIQVRRS